MATATAPVLTATDVTLTIDHCGRLYAVIPDAVARPLTVASHKGIDPKARGIYFESDRHAADSWVTRTVRVIFEAVVSSPLAAEDDHTWGLHQYRTYGGGTFYGFIVGESGWDAGARWWRDYHNTGDLRVGSCAHIEMNRRSLVGTCTFTS